MRFLVLVLTFLITVNSEAAGYYNMGAFWKGASDIDEWQAPTVPDEKRNATAVWTGTRMIVWGGRLGTGSQNGFSYDPVSDTWTPISQINAPMQRYFHTAVWTGSKMIVWGGTHYVGGGYSEVTNTGGIYDPATDTWTPTSLVNAPDERYRHSAVWDSANNQMIVWGGNTFSGFTKTGGRFNPTTNSWNSTPMQSTGNTPSARENHTAVWDSTNNLMIVWGGNDSSSVFNSGGRYNPATNSWATTSTGTNCPSARKQAPAVWTGTYMFVYGGYNNSNTPQSGGGRYNPATDTWAAVNASGSPGAWGQGTMVWDSVNNQALLWGGYNGSVIHNNGWKYNPSGNSWSSITTSGAPSGRDDHVAVFTGTQMIVWGGYDGTILDTGGVYNIAGNSWTPTKASLAPSARESATAIWTGSKMIVHGGYHYILGTYHNDGYSYDPVTDIWTPISSSNAPGGRNEHCAVWTGSIMIVWGGWFTSGWGGRYDPATDTWNPTALASSGRPTGYATHVCYWTGSEMISWGGVTGSGDIATPLNESMGKYNPATNTWSQIGTAGSPPTPAVLGASAWTGSNFIAWGGWDVNDNALNSGAIWNPGTDSWSTMPTSGRPSARGEMNYVWTGTELIMWAGADGTSNNLNDGARFNPSTNSWSPVSSSMPYSEVSYNGPFQTAFWTGKKVLFWGGGTYIWPDNWQGHVLIYNPANNTWKQGNKKYQPRGRWRQVGVWTGSKMIVYGGVNPDEEWDQYHNTRSYGIYTP